MNSRRAKSPTSGRATSSPTGERSAGRSPAAEPTSITTNQTNVTNNATHDDLSVTEPIKTPDVPLTENQRAAQAELDFLDDDSEITFDDNNSETLNSLDVSDIGPNIVIPGGGVGLTPTGQVFSNSSENVLNNQKNVVSSNGEYVIEFIDKYIDDACLANLAQITVVHGKGTGALRKGLHNYFKQLKKQKRISGYRDGEYGEGDLGVTVVML